MDRIDKDSNRDIEKFRLNLNVAFLSLLFLQFISYQIGNFGHWKIYHFNWLPVEGPPSST